MRDLLEKQELTKYVSSETELWLDKELQMNRS